VSFNAIAIGGLTSVSIPERTKGEAETTDSGASFNRTFLPGLRDGGSVNLTFRHDPADAGQTQLETNYNADGSGAVKQCIITLPAPATRTYTFSAFVTKPPTGDLPLVDDAVAEQSATVRVTGAVAIA
jgi:hypothetical protein